MLVAKAVTSKHPPGPPMTLGNMRPSSRKGGVRITALRTLALTAAFSPTIALACAPTPSCWIAAGPDYLRSVCKGYAEQNTTLQEIASYLDEPENVVAFERECRRLGVRLKWGKPEAKPTL